MQVAAANSSYTAYYIPNLCYSNMPRASLATFLIVTSLFSTASHLGTMASGTQPDEDLFALADIVSKIRTDRGSIVRVSLDFGNIVEATPMGVFHPATPSDISALIRFSLSQHAPFTVSPRGQGHSSRGQALASGGIVVDMPSLQGNNGGDRNHRVNVSVDGMYVDIGGEQLWIDVLRATLRHGGGFAPRVWTDYLQITVGGTLSNAGIGGQAFRHGPQISNVQELDVVTGTGDMITCSRSQNSDLFFATLGGLGQFGVITRARVGLEPAPKRVKWVRLAYSDVRLFTADQELLVSKVAGFDYVEGQVQLNRTLTEGRRSSSFFSASELARLRRLALDTGSAAIYYIEGAMYYDDYSAATVDKKLEALLEELSFVPGLVFIRDVAYVQFLDRVGQEEQKLRSAGVWDVPHPWLNLFIPKSRIHDFDAAVFRGVLKDAKPVGLILMYPMNKDKWDDRMTVMTPEEDVFYAIGLLRSAVAPGDLERLEKENEAVLGFCDQAGIGCKQYLPHYASQDAWRRHFGKKWGRVAERKAKYDPQVILSPGQGIFPTAVTSIRHALISAS